MDEGLPIIAFSVPLIPAIRFIRNRALDQTLLYGWI